MRGIRAQWLCEVCAVYMYERQVFRIHAKCLLLLAPLVQTLTLRMNPIHAGFLFTIEFASCLPKVLHWHPSIIGVMTHDRVFSICRTHLMNFMKRMKLRD